MTLWNVSIPPAADGILIGITLGPEQNTSPERIHISSRDMLPAQVGDTASAFLSLQINSPHD